MVRRQRPFGMLLRFAKLKGPTAALRAGRHNLRELALTPNIQPGHQHLNRVLLGPSTAQAIDAAYKNQLALAGVGKLRVDAVRLIEALVSLPVGIEDVHGDYFQAALNWLGAEFGSANLLSAVVHNDESAQHMHVLIVPLVHGRMQGSDLLGGKAQLRARLARFEQSMQAPAAALDLQHHAQNTLTAEQMAGAVIRELQLRKDPMWSSCVAQLLRNCIEDAPQQFYAALAPTLSHECSSSRRHAGTGRRPKRMKTMAEIFTKPVGKVRGSAAERYRQSEEYRLAHAVVPPVVPSPRAPIREKCSASEHSNLAAPSVKEVACAADQANSATVALPVAVGSKRSLCSVGFATAAVTWSIHSGIASLKQWRWIPKAPLEALAQTRHNSHAPWWMQSKASVHAMQSKDLRLWPDTWPDVLARRLLKWWWLKVRAP